MIEYVLVGFVIFVIFVVFICVIFMLIEGFR